MPISAGTRIGPFEILGPLGAGGMGEVYRARDGRLGRDVAIKSLRDLALADSDRIARFEREAQLLATLNHPHIAGIYGLEEAGGARFLILELVDGVTLAQFLSDGPPPLPEALTIARQVADALDAAHDQGIIHRDLKPANIALDARGQVKVLDFGLAKTLEPYADSPTTIPTTTGSGVILGTAAYMSPEQARGRTLDKRSDIWSFGCVLYELLTGRHPFPGQTISDTIAAILEREPDWTALPETVPARVRWLLRRCLEKDPRRRLHDIADARIELDEALSGAVEVDQPAQPAATTAGKATTRERLAWILAAAALVGFAALAAAIALSDRSGVQSAQTIQSYNVSVLLPEGLRLWAGNPPGRFALSPDGRRLVVVASDASGRRMLWVRPLDTTTAQPLPGTEGASFPFWSPDSRYVAFLAENKLKRVDAAGGLPITLADASIGATGAWNRDNVILFTPGGGAPLSRVSALGGGTPTAVTTLDTVAGDAQHWYPSFLPDGRHFLFFVVGSKKGGVTDPRAVHVGSLDPNEPPRLLIPGGANAKYANGHVVYLRDGTLIAHAFDTARLELTGEPTPLVERVQIAQGGTTGVAGAFAVSETGVLAYQTGLLVRSQLAWFDRFSGSQVSKLGDLADYADSVLSPDGSRVAVSLMDPVEGTRDLWIYDVSRSSRDRFTFDRGDDFAPIWSPDGSRIIFSSRRGAGVQLYQKMTRGSGTEALLFADDLGKFAADWSLDGRFVVYVGGGGILSRSDLWALPLFGDRKAFPIFDSRFVESHGRLSPDGRTLAYMSGESLRQEVYLTPFPDKGDRTPVSTAGGGWPRWRRDGKELFYLAPDNTLMAVDVTGQFPQLRVGIARPLFRISPRPMLRLDAYAYDVSADGRRFLVNTFVEDTTTPSISLVVNWLATMAR